MLKITFLNAKRERVRFLRIMFFPTFLVILAQQKLFFWPMSLADFNSNDIHSLSPQDLHHLQQLIETNTVTKSAAANYFKMDRKRFGEFMENNGYPLTAKKAGTPKKEISEETKKLILDAHSKYPQGSTKIYYQMINDIERASTYQGDYKQSPQLSYIPL